MKPSKRPLRPKMNEFGVGEAETAHNSQNESNGMRSSVNDSSKPAMKSQPFTQQTDYTKPQSRPREEDLPHHQTKSEVVDSKPKGNSYTNSLTSQNHSKYE